MSKNLHNKTKSKKTFLFFLLSGFLFSLLSISFLFLVQTKTHKGRKEVSSLPKNIKKQLIQTASSSASFRIPILMYHYVEYVTDTRDTIRKSLALTPYVFDKQVETLQNAGYTFMTTKDLADVLDGKTTLPEKPVILTFDDGYRDFYTDVFPLLKKHKVKAVAYIVPGFLDKLNYMFTPQVEEVAKSGLVEIAAHTVHHVWLKGMTKERAEFEITESKKMLEESLHISIVSFAYPYGAFDQQAADIVKKAGFKTAVSTVPGIMDFEQNRFFLYRLRPGGRIGKELLTYLTQNVFKAY